MEFAPYLFFTGGKCEEALNFYKSIFGGEIRKVLQNLLLGHAGSQILEDVVDGNAQAANARLAAALAGLDSDELLGSPQPEIRCGGAESQGGMGLASFPGRRGGLATCHSLSLEAISKPHGTC